jgi:glycerol-3-phosphate dehydrogenase (NAD(P)+)
MAWNSPRKPATGVALPAGLRYEADLEAALSHALADDALCVVATPAR